jgi:hypothetical protein
VVCAAPVDLVGERHEAGATPEVVGEGLEAMGAVLYGPVTGLGQVHRPQHSPAPAIGFGAPGRTRLLLHHAPGLADGGEALEQVIDSESSDTPWVPASRGPEGETIAATATSKCGSV